jgi:hypothetical protein
LQPFQECGIEPRVEVQIVAWTTNDPWGTYCCTVQYVKFVFAAVLIALHQGEEIRPPGEDLFPEEQAK